jgi:MYXO-CTERM domain-containing protein
MDSCFSCETSGYPLAWSQSNIEYVFNARGIPSFSDAEMRQVYKTAVDQWLSASCGGERTDLDVTAAPGTTQLVVRDRKVASSTNVFGYMTQAEWSAAGFDPHAFAQTGVRYYPDTGVIAGADIWLNGGIGEFGVCPDRGCDGRGDTVDLPNVVTHEVGHFFGLAHSGVEGATMACDALPGQTDKRDLALDDRLGMCAMYPPGEAFSGPYLRGEWTRPAVQTESSCSVAPGRTAAGSALPVLVGLLGFVALRRRRASRVGA